MAPFVPIVVSDIKSEAEVTYTRPQDPRLAKFEVLSLSKQDHVGCVEWTCDGAHLIAGVLDRSSCSDCTSACLIIVREDGRAHNVSCSVANDDNEKMIG
jgi:hypothetical protein